MKSKLIEVAGLNIFYREAGRPEAETILLLHGFPSSSHMYREVIAKLSDKYHLIAPDYPGFGLSESPTTDVFAYTFDNIADVIQQFIRKLNLQPFYLLMQDYGGPIGMRLATAKPEQIKGLIIQNANAYMEGLGEWAIKIGGFQKSGDMEGLAAFKNYLMSLNGLKEQYLEGAGNPTKVDPISYLMDNAFLNRANARDIQTALFMNYGTNFPKYSEWQNYLREHQPRTLVLWGENDKFFSKAGGEAYAKDLENIEMYFFNGGHFLLEEYADEAVGHIQSFIN